MTTATYRPRTAGDRVLDLLVTLANIAWIYRSALLGRLQLAVLFAGGLWFVGVEVGPLARFVLLLSTGALIVLDTWLNVLRRSAAAHQQAADAASSSPRSAR